MKKLIEDLTEIPTVASNSGGFSVLLAHVSGPRYFMQSLRVVNADDEMSRLFQPLLSLEDQPWGSGFNQLNPVVEANRTQSCLREGVLSRTSHQSKEVGKGP